MERARINPVIHRVIGNEDLVYLYPLWKIHSFSRFLCVQSTIDVEKMCCKVVRINLIEILKLLHESQQHC
jgi:hypothetical protein